MKNIKALYAAAVLGLAAAGCTQDNPVTWPPVDKTPVEIERGTFAKGADVSWVTEHEALGYSYRTPGGDRKELMELLRDDCGVNAIRLRVWVNPKDGWNNIDDVMVKARRANALGMRLMIDFHFSDTWADPGQQAIPEAWADMSLDEVLAAMSEHVGTLMGSLKRYNIEPEWVQIGNETRTGMMWPLGSTAAASGDNFTRMVNAGYDAVKAVFPDALVIVHLDCGDQFGLYDFLFGKIMREGARFDMIGMSLYPDPSSWKKTVQTCVTNIDKCQRTFGKPVMVCEIGLDYREAAAADEMMRMLMTNGRAVGLKGIFWWEPAAPPALGYTKGCFDENGAPTEALNCFKD